MAHTSTTAPRLLEGRLALITGAGQGCGRALALGLAKAGARVVVTDLNSETVKETADQVLAAGGAAWAFRLDITSAEDCQALSERIRVEIGEIDLLVNNAGIIFRETMSSPTAAASWKKTLDVNVQGVFNVTHAMLAALCATQGCIVNIASTAAFSGQPASIGYSPSKGAIKMFTQSLAVELAPQGVRVNALAPGMIATPMTIATRADPKRFAWFMSRIPLGRIAEPDDLVGPVVFLASDMSRYVTGVTLPVDGGFLAA